MKPEDEARNPGVAIGAKILHRFMRLEGMARDRFEQLEAETAEFEAAKPQEDPDLMFEDPTGADSDQLLREVMEFESNLKAIQKNPKTLLRKLAQNF